jgi:hypothetical protein
VTRDTIIHALVPKMRVERRDPKGQTFGPDDKNFLATYRGLLDALGIEDPSDFGEGNPRRALDLLAHAISLRKSARAMLRAHADPDADLATKVATGEVDPGAVGKTLAKTKELAERRKLEQMVIARSADRAFRNGITAIRNVGEKRWLGILRPIVEQAIRDKDQLRWSTAHRFGAFLRDPDIAALSSAVSGQKEVPRFHYMFRDWAAVNRWQVERATHTYEKTNVHAGEYAFVTIGFNPNHVPPFPGVADFDPEWGAGIYSADEAVANADAIWRRQEAEIDTASPEARPRTKVFI